MRLNDFMSEKRARCAHTTKQLQKQQKPCTNSEGSFRHVTSPHVGLMEKSFAVVSHFGANLSRAAPSRSPSPIQLCSDTKFEDKIVLRLSVNDCDTWYVI